MLGIFWFLPDFSELFYVKKICIEQAEKYEEWLICQADHSNEWARLEQSGYLHPLPKRYRAEYWLLPRGRVSYNVRLGKYFVYHGNWFTREHAKIIEVEFEIKSGNVVYEEDEHYYIKKAKALSIFKEK